jgi:DNA-directed RNA polymerase subunit N (RpoN/RPB10)
LQIDLHDRQITRHSDQNFNFSERPTTSSAMIIPVRCFSCGKVTLSLHRTLSNKQVIGDKWEQYLLYVQEYSEGYLHPVFARS